MPTSFEPLSREALSSKIAEGKQVMTHQIEQSFQEQAASYPSFMNSARQQGLAQDVAKDFTGIIDAQERNDKLVLVHGIHPLDDAFSYGQRLAIEGFLQQHGLEQKQEVSLGMEP